MQTERDKLLALAERLHPSIAENEAATWRLKFKATRDALRAERECEHSVIVYSKGSAGEYFGPRPTVCICLQCRMEYHYEWHCNPVLYETLDHRFIEASRLGLRSIYSLRTNDKRNKIKCDGWDCKPPVRRPRQSALRTKGGSDGR